MRLSLRLLRHWVEVTALQESLSLGSGLALAETWQWVMAMLLLNLL